MTELTRDEKMTYMAVWSAKNGFQLNLQGEVGFGRECVGILHDSTYPEYEWYDDDYERVDNNGDVFVPDNAYHKGPYVAVLGRGEEAEDQLYQWIKWFDENNFKLETGELPLDPNIPTALSIILGKHQYVRLVKQS